MKKIILVLLLSINYLNSATDSLDGLKTFKSDALEVVAKKPISPFDAMISGTDFNSSLFDKNGKSLIRRGMIFTQDIYTEGFKRNDIKILIDGEQYHNACPNRMDAPAGRVNPFEMEMVEMSKSGSQRGAGIYGKVEYHRKTVPLGISSGLFLNANLISSEDFDGGINLGYDGIGVNARISGGNPYLNADGKDFKSLYGYKDNYSYLSTRISVRGNSGDFKYGASFNKLDDILFPYLQMDEVATKVYSADFAYEGHKMYFNYTDHLMDNTLRVSPMYMMSDAKNFTLGLVGDFYEFTYRNWDAQNQLVNSAMNVNIKNNMMPNINQLYGGFNHRIILDNIEISARAGAVYYKIGNNTPLEFYKILYSDSKDNRIFGSGGLNIQYFDEITNEFSFAISSEISLDAPEAEQLYVNVKKPGVNPDWSGNPTLKQPIKSNLRLKINNNWISIEGYFNYIDNFVNISKELATKNIQTFTNVDAIIAGINFVMKYDMIQSSISYIYGEDIYSKNPLPEIMPLSITNSFNLSEIYGINTSIIHRYENYQPRIAKELKEFSSDAWNTLSAGIHYTYKKIMIRAEIDNILNHQYYRFLSYARNPFSSGIPVYEPGTTLRLTLIYDNIF